jgi:hypothetical protein
MENQHQETRQERFDRFYERYIYWSLEELIVEYETIENTPGWVTAMADQLYVLHRLILEKELGYRLN